MKTEVTQLINNNGKPATNQFVLIDGNKTTFQSYKTTIAQVYSDGLIILDKNALNYSETTSKHLFIFLNKNRKEIETLIKSDRIILRNLNK